MTNCGCPHTNCDETTSIKNTVQHYIDGAISGKGDDMRPAFHENATIFGYVGEDLFAGPIEMLFAWNDDNGPATDLSFEIENVDIEGTVATVRLKLDNWTGHNFTDMFTLAKTNREWKIISKVFHLHA